MFVGQRWSQAEVFLSAALPWLCVIAFLYGCYKVFKGAKLSILDLAVASWGIYYLSRVWIGAEYPCATQVLRDMELLILFISLRVICAHHNIKSWYFTWFIIALGCFEALMGLDQMWFGSARNHAFIITGSFMNPGPYSAYIMIALILMICEKNNLFEMVNSYSVRVQLITRYIYWIFALLLLLVLSATCSRAAIIPSCVICLWIFRHHYWNRRYLVWCGAVMLAVSFYFLKQGSADGRMLTWTASLTSWLQKPWIGIGVGGFRNACAEGISQMYASNPDNALFAAGNVSEYAFCDILKVLVEQGVIGVILCMTVVGAALYYTYKWSRPIFYGLLSLLIFSLFSYPFELYPYRVIAVVCAAIVPHQGIGLYIKGWSKKIFLSIMWLPVLAMSLFVAKEVARRSEIDKDVRLFSGMQHAAFIKDYYELLPDEYDNPQFLFDFAKTLRNEGRYNDSNAMLRQGAAVSNDPMFYVLQGNNYKDMECYDYAEKAYKKAYSVMPNRIYPLYQLMLLYEHTGQKQKMLRMARKIIDTQPKVKSRATEEMTEKARTKADQTAKRGTTEMP